MSYAEFKSWIAYYDEHPFDDHHRYHRPAVLISQSMSGGDVKAKFEFLVPPKSDFDINHLGSYSEADLQTFAALGVKPPSI